MLSSQGRRGTPRRCGEGVTAPTGIGSRNLTVEHVPFPRSASTLEFSILEVATAQKETALPKVADGKRREITSRADARHFRTVIAAGVGELLVGSNHAKAALLAVGGRLFQSFKGANPRVINFGLPIKSGLSFFLVAGSEPLLRREILDDHPRRLVPKSDGAPPP